MNALLIYNSNVPYKLVEDFKQLELGESSSFEVSRSELLLQNFDIDVKMHSFLMDEDIECQNFDVIFVAVRYTQINSIIDTLKNNSTEKYYFCRK